MNMFGGLTGAQTTMKKMKPHSTQRCSYCAERATWRTSGLTSQVFACSQHKPLAEIEEQNKTDDGYMTEADYEIRRRFGV